MESLPYPPRGGVELRNWGTVNAVGALGPVAVFGIRPIDRAPGPGGGIEVWERSHDPGAGRLLSRGWDRPAAEWRDDPGGHPLSFPISDTVLTELTDITARFAPDVVIIEQLWLHGCIDACKQMGVPVVLDAHNVEGELIPALVASAVNGNGHADANGLTLIAKRAAAVEAAAISRVDTVWACSQADAATLSRLYRPPGPVRVVPHALDLDSYPTPERNGSPRNGGSGDVVGPAIVFPGVFSYPPNSEAAQWLAGDIFPSLVARFPGARLTLVGPEPTPAMVTAGAAEPRLTVTGEVPDVRPYLTNATAMAVPLRNGGGARLKVLEAFASGIPVISTEKGVEGLGVAPGEQYLRAEGTEEFCQAIAEVAGDGRLRARLVARAREHVRERHSFDAVSEAVRAALPRGDRRLASAPGARAGAPIAARGTRAGAPIAARRAGAGAPSAPETAGARRLARPTLSLCVTTRGPAERIRALLLMLRPHVDEIVLAVDRRGDPRTASACSDLADRVLGYELEEEASPAKLIGWAMHQCQAEWILRLDDDEAPAAALLEALPRLLADRHIMQVAFSRRWLFPDGRRWLTTFPWGHDSQTRLVRNLPGLWSFGGWNHEEGRFRGERRWLDMPLYHCDLVANELPARRRKSAWYERIEPGQHWDGFPVNRLYVPEDCGPLHTEPVPLEDQPFIDALLAPAELGEAPPPTDISPPAVAWDEIDGHNLTSPDLSTARAQITLVRPRDRVPVACERSFQVVTKNLGSQPWPAGPDSPIRLGYRWINAGTGRPLPDEGFRTSLTETVWPGQSTRLHIHTRTPHVSGDFVLSVQLVHESVAWIEEPGRTAVFVDDERPAEAPPFVPHELRTLSARLWQQLDESDRIRSQLARELALAESRALALRDMRRYRLGAALARPLDAVRARMRART